MQDHGLDIDTLQQLFQFVLKVTLGLSSNDCLDYLTRLKKNECGDIPDTESGRGLAAFINIHLSYFNLTFVLLGQFLHNRPYYLAGTAPFRPKINHGRHIGIHNLFIKIFIRHLHQIGHA